MGVYGIEYKTCHSVVKNLITSPFGIKTKPKAKSMKWCPFFVERQSFIFLNVSQEEPTEISGLILYSILNITYSPAMLSFALDLLRTYRIPSISSRSAICLHCIASGLLLPTHWRQYVHYEAFADFFGEVNSRLHVFPGYFYVPLLEHLPQYFKVNLFSDVLSPLHAHPDPPHQLLSKEGCPWYLGFPVQCLPKSWHLANTYWMEQLLLTYSTLSISEN